MTEAILTNNSQRHVLYPISHGDVFELYKRSVACFWTAEEIDLVHDMKDWDKLTDKEQHFIKYSLAFFAASDGIVSENLALNFYDEVKLPEARCFYGFQTAMENIHSEVYSLLIDTYVRDTDEKSKLLNAANCVDAVKRKADWALKWLDKTKATFAERLVAFAVVEGVFFSSSFCSIFWLKKRGLMPGLCFSNELISRDEGLHCDFACLLYGKLAHRLSRERVHEIMEEAVAAEVHFSSEALPVTLIGINSAQMTEYVKFCADNILSRLGYEPKYSAHNPFEWMDMISLQGKTNFFEKRVGEYSKSRVGVAADKREFCTTEEF